MSLPTPQSESLQQLPSPALLFRESTVDRNLDQMVALVGDPKRLRPHVKTHKCPQIISRHIQRGIRKFKCATIAEAEMVARNGAQEILLAKQAVGPDIGRLADLVATYPNVTFQGLVDHMTILQATSEHFSRQNREIELLVDVDCGMQRTGVSDPAQITELIRGLTALPNVIPGGLHVYDGHLHDPDRATRKSRCEAAMQEVSAWVAAMKEENLPVPRIVAGGSPTFALHAENPAVDECSPGTTVLWDAGYQGSFPDLPFEPAALVMTRVISQLSEDAVCVDLGHKAIAADKEQPRVIFPTLPDAQLEVHSEEHLRVRSPLCASLKPGDVLFGIPRHICPTVSLYDYASILNDADEVIDQWPIEARSRRLSI